MSTVKSKHFHLIEDMDISALTLAATERVQSMTASINSSVKAWARRSNERRSLAQMSDRMLNDIGLNRIDVDREAGKYFWQK